MGVGIGIQVLRVWWNKTGGEMKGAMWKKLGNVGMCGVWGEGMYYIIYIIIYNYIIMGLRWG